MRKVPLFLRNKKWKVKLNMINLYFTGNCSSLFQVKEWFSDQGIAFREVRLSDDYLLRKTLFSILPLLEGDITDMICKSRRKSYKHLINNEKGWTVCKLIEQIINYPQILHQPIICDGISVQFGFNSDEIRTFIPKKIRVLERQISKEKSEAAFLKKKSIINE